MASSRQIFMSCEVVRTLRTIVPHENRIAQSSQTLAEFAEDYLCTTLEGEAEFQLEADLVGLLSRVEGRAQVPPHTLSNSHDCAGITCAMQVGGPILSRYSGLALEICMEDVRAQGMRSLTFVLQGKEPDAAFVEQAELDGEVRGAAAVMAAARGVHLPDPISVSDQRDAITNRLLDEFRQNPSYGGFTDLNTARSTGLQQLKRLSQVLYFLSPFYE